MLRKSSDIINLRSTIQRYRIGRTLCTNGPSKAFQAESLDHGPAQAGSGCCAGSSFQKNYVPEIDKTRLVRERLDNYSRIVNLYPSQNKIRSHTISLSNSNCNSNEFKCETNLQKTNFSTAKWSCDKKRKKYFMEHGLSYSYLHNYNSLRKLLFSLPADYFMHNSQSVHLNKSTRNFHTGPLNGNRRASGVPDYLLGSIIEVVRTEEEDDLENSDNGIEEEIIEFFTCRAIPYDEADSSFSVPCPTCNSTTDHNKHMRDIFVDKLSGYYVCPWCCGAGSWEELCQVLDARQDTLTTAQLAAVLEATLPLDDRFTALYNNTVCKNTTAATLRKYGCRSSSDGSRLIVPVFCTAPTPAASEAGHQQQTGLHTVGYYSVSLLHSKPQIVSRFLSGQTTAWSSCMQHTPDSNSCATEVCHEAAPSVAVAVSLITEALQLAQCGLCVVTVPGCVADWHHVLVADRKVQHEEDPAAPLAEPLSQGGTAASVWPDVWGLVPSVKSVVLWLTQANTLPYRFFTHLAMYNIRCSAVSPAGSAPLYQLTEEKITGRLAGDLLPLLSDKITSFGTIQEQVYYRITHKQEVCGVPWRRFPDLQALLLGHRPGEVTVLSGPTGAGKTTLVSEYSLDLATQGVVTLWVSLEVSIVRLCEVLLQQYSGAPLPQERHLFTSLAQHFQQLPIYFLDLHGQQELHSMIEVLRESVVVRGVRHIIVDNLQFLVGCQDTASERWQQQDRAMAAFRTFATQHNCHVTLIVHPRKLQVGEPLTLQSIGGGARVTQEADNVLLLQVMGGPSPTSSRKAIQVVKNRYGGHLGIVPIRFHAESLTFSGCFRKAKDSTKPARLSKTEKAKDEKPFMNRNKFIQNLEKRIL